MKSIGHIVAVAGSACALVAGATSATAFAPHDGAPVQVAPATPPPPPPRGAAPAPCNAPAAAGSAAATAAAMGAEIDARIDAYIAALETYDLGIQSLRWRESVRAEPDGAPSTNIWRGEIGILDDGRWMARGERFDALDEKGRQDSVPDRFLFDGTRLLAYSPQAQRGIIRGEGSGDLLRSLETPLMLIGRDVDFGRAGTGQSRLPDLLRRAVERELADDGGNLVTISGSVKIGSKWFRVTVVLDRTRGHMPVRITRQDEETGVLKEEVRVTEAMEIAGGWIPVSGWREVSSVAIASDEVATRLQAPELAARLEAMHLDRERRADRLKLLAFMTEAAGAAPFRPKLLGGGRHVVTVSEISRVAEPAERDRLLAMPFDEGARVYELGSGRSYRFVSGELVPIPEDSSAAVSQSAATPR